MMAGVIESVLVPLDGSALAEEALPLGQALALRAGVPLRLVRVIDRDRTSEAERQAEHAVSEAARQAGVEAQLRVRAGDAAEEILREAGDLPRPLIVMTTHGRSGIGRWLIGSVADRVVRGGAAPVLLLRSGTSLGDAQGFRRLLVPLDGSALAEDALPLAVTLAHVFAAEVHLARVAETTRLFTLTGTSQSPIPDTLLEEMVADLEAEAGAYLRPVVERLRPEGVPLRAVVLDGIPVEALLAYTATHEIDLVVLATHGRGGFNRLVLGSVAERLLRQGQTPILMVPPMRGAAERPDADRAAAAGSAQH